MGVRMQINRYRTTPSGYDYKDVLKRGKAFYTFHGAMGPIYHDDFEMQPCGFGDHILWSAESTTIPPFLPPKGTIFVHWNGKKWEESAVAPAKNRG